MLPHDVLGPARHEFLVAELVGVLEVQQAGHQAKGQARAARGSNACAHGLNAGVKQIIALNACARAHLAGKDRRQRRFDLAPQQAACQYRQGVVLIDHLRQGLAKEVRHLSGLGHGQIPSENHCLIDSSWGIGFLANTSKLKDSCGAWGICRGDH